MRTKDAQNGLDFPFKRSIIQPMMLRNFNKTRRSIERLVAGARHLYLILLN